MYTVTHSNEENSKELATYTDLLMLQSAQSQIKQKKLNVFMTFQDIKLNPVDTLVGGNHRKLQETVNFPSTHWGSDWRPLPITMATGNW